jgi:acyl carrier protein
MRILTLAVLATLVLLGQPVLACQSSGVTVPSVQIARVAELAVLKHSARILGIPIDKLQHEKPYANQVVAGDALDIVKIVMAIEDDLSIAVDDEILDVSVGASGVADIAQRLTIARLQQVVHSILAQSPNNSFKQSATLKFE